MLLKAIIMCENQAKSDENSAFSTHPLWMNDGHFVSFPEKSTSSPQIHGESVEKSTKNLPILCDCPLHIRRTNPYFHIAFSRLFALLNHINGHLYINPFFTIL
jgi:hypothetical protein